jgi:hypothetical protein
LRDLGAPAVGLGTELDTPAPSGYIERPAEDIDDEGKHIFVRGADNQLFERLDGDITINLPRWESRTRTADPDVRGDPVVAVTTAPLTVHAVSASGRNSLVSWQFEIREGTSASQPNRRAVLLDEDQASETDDAYVGFDLEIVPTSGPGESRPIVAYDGLRRLVRVNPPLSALPDTSSDCVIDAENLGHPRADTTRLLALHDPVTDGRTARAAALRIDGDFLNLNDVDFYSRRTGVVSLAPPHPSAPFDFAMYAEVLDEPTEHRVAEDSTTVPELSWEYWNGRGWLSLDVTDTTGDLLANGSVRFVVPESIEATEVAGQESFWIRARLVGGDYGRETFKIVNNTVVSEKNSLRPPKVRTLEVFYDAPLEPPGACVTFNNLDYVDQTAAIRSSGAHFRPFEPLENTSLALFFGFDRSFSAGPVRLLLDAVERDYDESRPPEFEWRFRRDRRWKLLDADDGSAALTRQGVLTLSASEALTQETRFNESLFWIRGALVSDRASYPRPVVRGVFLNTVWAVHGETVTEEIIGSGDGEPNQIHAFRHATVLGGEDLRVREVLSEQERGQIERLDGKDAVVDREDVGGTWVRWKETAALFESGPRDRVFELDRATGTIRFGDGVNGSIPPAGADNIRAFRYRAGGGAAGNVDAGRLEALATAVAGIDSVFNPTAAGGGSDTADTEAMLTIGPRRISHGDRAVSADDFEELALEASRQVARVRCLASTNLTRSGEGRRDPCDPAQRHEAAHAPGWISLIIVPNSPDPRPCPSIELRRSVRDYLRERAPVSAAIAERIVVRPPDYVEITIEAEIFVRSIEVASLAKSMAQTALDELLHPIRGGPDETGWDFGRPLFKSDVFATLERIALIDRVENLLFRFSGGTHRDRVAIGPNELPASGPHRLEVRRA